MHNLKQVAPFFNLKTEELKEILTEINIVYPLERTKVGAFKVRDADLSVIELYLNIKRLFNKKNEALNQLEFLLYEKDYYKTEQDWLMQIKKKNGYV